MIVDFLFVEGLLGERGVEGLGGKEFGTVGKVEGVLGVLWYVLHDVSVEGEVGFCKDFCLYYLG